MIKPKHTPGPWRLHFSAVKDANGWVVADVHGRPGLAREAQRERAANTRLIARAPSMLALLEKALPIIEAEADNRAPADFESGSYFTEMRELAEEIAAEIAKATKGESA